MLGGFDHQVAGHVEETLLGACGRFVLKPLVKKDLFQRETSFYDKTLESPHSTNSVARFTAQYYGLLHCKPDDENDTVEGSSSRERLRTTLPHIVLEDLTNGYVMPNVIDIKMGTCTYEPTASLEKKEKEVRKYPHQKDLGFRVTGFKVYDRCSDCYLKTGKPFGRSVQPSEAVAALAVLFSDGTGAIRTDVIRALLVQLEPLLQWMASQTQWRFFCSSLLVVYDASEGGLDEEEQLGRRLRSASLSAVASRLAEDCSTAVLERMRQHVRQTRYNTGEGCTPLVRVKMIDFAHVVEVGSPLDLQGCARNAAGAGRLEQNGHSGCGAGFRDCVSETDCINAEDASVEAKGDSAGAVESGRSLTDGVSAVTDVSRRGKAQARAMAQQCADPGYVRGLTRLIAGLRQVLQLAEAGGEAAVQLQRDVEVLRERARQCA